MRSFLFTAKIALLFFLLLGLSLGGTFLLFVRVAAPALAQDISRLRAHEAINAAGDVEAMLDTLPPAADVLESEPFQRALLQIAEDTDLWLEVGREVEPPTIDHPWQYHFHPSSLEIRGRRLSQLGPPAFDLWLPILQNGEEIGHMRVRGPSHAAKIHYAFERGVLRIAGLSLISVLVMSWVLTKPLRRMSQSMDRIAAGELDHRVAIRGQDEVAAMGASFNTMADRIQEMVIGQKEMLAGVSHELRSPLGRMKLGLELLRGDRDHEPKGSARIDALEEEVDQVDALIDEILTASRLDLGVTPLETEALDLGAAIRDAWHRSEPVGHAPRSGDAPGNLGEDSSAHSSQSEILAPQAAPELQLRLEGQPQVQADPRLLGKILGNLLANARRHAKGIVRVSAAEQAGRVAEQGGRIEVEIADDGSGAAEGENLDRLFEPFYRADSARGHDRHVGMGLAIVRGAVEAHGGQARARRSELGGLAFVVDLPTAVSGNHSDAR